MISKLFDSNVGRWSFLCVFVFSVFNILMVMSYLAALALNLTACRGTAGVSEGNYNIPTEIGFQKGFLSSCF